MLLLRPVLALALLAPMLVVASPTDAAVCEQGDVVHVPGQGPSCARADGLWEVLLPDGARLLTHGPDPMPQGGTFVSINGATPAEPKCASLAGDFAGVAIYARPADAPDRYATMSEEVRGMIAAANGLLRREAAIDGATLDYRMRCELDGRVRVDNVVLPLLSSEADFTRITAELRALGYVSPLDKYWVWYDGRVACSCSGQGNLQLDSKGRPDNLNNLGPSYGLTYRQTGSWGAFVMMHENGHNLGAVSNLAPDSSGAHHCNDAHDVMCYADGGPTSNYRTVCADRLHFDCDGDSYFGPRVAKGSWLGRHWNLGAPYNRWVDGCDGATLVVTPALAATTPVKPDCAGARYATYGVGYVDIYRTCWRDAAGALISCDDGDASGHAVVPDGAAFADVSTIRGPGGRVTLSVV